MKALFDFLPVILFFVAFKLGHNSPDAAADWLQWLPLSSPIGAKEAPMMLATLTIMVATLLQIVWLYARHRRVDKMPLVSLVLIVVLGSLTLWLHNPLFVMWKPTLLYWLMAVVLLLSPLFFGKNLLQSMLGGQLELPSALWSKLNVAWVVFFALIGLLNLWVAYRFSEAVWVNFKLFGLLGLMLLFLLAQGLLLGRYLNEASSEASDR